MVNFNLCGTEMNIKGWYMWLSRTKMSIVSLDNKKSMPLLNLSKLQKNSLQMHLQFEHSCKNKKLKLFLILHLSHA